MKVKHSGQWKDAEAFVRHSGTWKSPTTSVCHNGKWHEFESTIDMLDAKLLVEEYYYVLYGFNHEEFGSITPNKFLNSNGTIIRVVYNRRENSTEILMKYPKKISLATVTINNKSREIIMIDYYGEYRGRFSGDFFMLSSNENKTLSILVEVM